MGYVKNALLYKSDLKEDEVIDERLSDEINETFDNLKVTHGIDHQIYKKFEEFVAKSVNLSLSQN